ncbi:hypothetical protein D3C84_1169460 [compost metagenome]
MPVAAEHQVDQQAQHTTDGDQVEPLEVVQDEVGSALEDCASPFGEEGARQYEGYDSHQRDDRYGGIEAFQQT